MLVLQEKYGAFRESAPRCPPARGPLLIYISEF